MVCNLFYIFFKKQFCLILPDLSLTLRPIGNMVTIRCYAACLMNFTQNQTFFVNIRNWVVIIRHDNLYAILDVEPYRRLARKKLHTLQAGGPTAKHIPILKFQVVSSLTTKVEPCSWCSPKFLKPSKDWNRLKDQNGKGSRLELLAIQYSLVLDNLSNGLFDIDLNFKS